jgi:hypothetical protein
MTFYEILDYLTWLSPIVLLAGTIVAFMQFGNLGFTWRVIAGYLLFELLVDISSRIIGRLGTSNLIVIPVMNCVELIVFLGIYSSWFKRKYRAVLAVILTVFGCLMIREIWEIVTLPVGQVQTYTGVLEAFCIVSFALFRFMNNVKNPDRINWQIFSLNAVVLFYFSVKLIFSIPLNFLVNEDSGLSLLFWFAYLIITVFFYCYLIYALWKNGRIRA